MPTVLDLLNRINNDDAPATVIFDGIIYNYTNCDYRSSDVEHRFLSDDLSRFSLMEQTQKDVITYYDPTEMIPIVWLEKYYGMNSPVSAAIKDWKKNHKVQRSE